MELSSKILQTLMLLHQRTTKIFNQACLLQRHGCNG